jgi:hypothetical protein
VILGGISPHGIACGREGIVGSDYAKRLSNVSKLDDDSSMPFGIHKGTRLGDLPDSYFRWFLERDWCDEWPDLVQYANHVLED